MADVRCPMCSKPNPAEAEVCQFCGARIKPLIISQPPATPPTVPPGEMKPPARKAPTAPPPEDQLAGKASPPEPAGGAKLPPKSSLPGTDWLGRIRRRVQEEAPGPEEEEEPESEPEAEPADWLARLRESEAEPDRGQAPPAGRGPVEPAKPKTEPPPVELPPAPEAPDWLGRLRAADSAEKPGPPEGEIPDWLAGVGETPIGEAEGGEPPAPETPEAEPAEVPDWLARIRVRKASTPIMPGGEAALTTDDLRARLRAEPAQAPDQAEQPKTAPFKPVEAPPAPPAAPAEPAGLSERLKAKPEELPPTGPSKPEEALPTIEPGEEAPPKRGGMSGILGRLRRAPGRPAPSEVKTPPRPPLPLPEDLGAPPEAKIPAPPELARPADLGAPPELKAPARPPLPLPEDLGAPPELKAPARPPLPLPEDLGAPPELKAPARPGLMRPEGPGAPPEAKAAPGTGLPHMRALIRDAGPATPPAGPADLDLNAIEIPDWLSESAAAEVPPEAPPVEGKPSLERATLPAWLEAMRPVETFRPVVEITPEDEQSVEAAGPLSGLRGVLLAEPVVAMPRSSTIGASRLEVTERQYAQAELMRKLVEDEQRETPAAVEERPRLPVLRWAVAGLLILAVALPPLVGWPSFSLPTAEPRELRPLMDLVSGLPVDRPVLVVFDYEPGFAGELDAVAAPLLEDMMARGLRIITLSTRPTGPPLAERLVQRVGAAHAYQNGRDYLHLGYLSGGTPAVQLFAAAPREAVLSGFDAPLPAEGGGAPARAWDSPVLSGVQRLADFGMVAVITTGMESVRTWAEQAGPWLGGRPLVMVLSAGAEPLARPYYEALHPQVNGLLTGMPAAVAFEVRNGRPGDALVRWNAFGSGVMVVEGILAAGLLYGLAAWLLRRRAA